MKADEEHLVIFEGASAGRYPQRSRPSEQRHNDERREPRRSLRTKPPGGGAEKPSKGGIPKGRHCFAGAKCRSSSPKQRGRRETARQKSANGFSPPGCGDNRPGALLASRLQPAAGMRPRSRLARGPFFPQRPLCDFISASLQSNRLQPKPRLVFLLHN